MEAGRPEAAAAVYAWAQGYGEDVRLEPWLSQVACSFVFMPPLVRPIRRPRPPF